MAAPVLTDTQPLTYGQLVGLARDAGLSPMDAQIAAAVALAESGGNPLAYNGRGPDRSYGLWQINMIGSLGPARRASLGLPSNDALFDPATNARAMAAISSGGQNWQPWSTYTSGRYKAFMGGGGTGSLPPGSTAPPPASTMPVSAPNDCLIGGGSVDVLPNPIPFGQSVGIPCLFKKSWGWAILSGLAMVGGAIVVMVGAVTVAKASMPTTAISRLVGVTS